MADGAALVLLATPQACARLGLQPRARWVASASLGHAPETPPVAAALAAQQVLERAAAALQLPCLTAEELQAVELHDAFAVQALAFAETLGLPLQQLNAGGGGLARGHPIGASGAVALVRMLSDLHRTPAAHRPALGLAAIAGWRHRRGLPGAGALNPWTPHFPCPPTHRPTPFPLAMRMRPWCTRAAPCAPTGPIPCRTRCCTICCNRPAGRPAAATCSQASSSRCAAACAAHSHRRCWPTGKAEHLSARTTATSPPHAHGAAQAPGGVGPGPVQRPGRGPRGPRRARRAVRPQLPLLRCARGPGGEHRRTLRRRRLHGPGHDPVRLKWPQLPRAWAAAPSAPWPPTPTPCAACSTCRPASTSSAAWPWLARRGRPVNRTQTTRAPLTEYFRVLGE